MDDDAPIIETPRTFLRRITPEDRGFVERLYWLDTDRVYRRTMQMYKEGGYGFWTIVLTDSGCFAGLCGLLDQDIDGCRELEVGYHLLPEHQGRGLATETARAVMQYAFDKLRKRRLISIILPDNEGSIGVAKKNGLVLEKAAVFRDLDVLVFSATRDNWNVGT
jgi:RimJ/RimL family protein N-acetyltransferase